jgi:hypothetical protein
MSGDHFLRGEHGHIARCADKIALCPDQLGRDTQSVLNLSDGRQGPQFERLVLWYSRIECKWSMVGANAAYVKRGYLPHLTRNASPARKSATSSIRPKLKRRGGAGSRGRRLLRDIA